MNRGPLLCVGVAPGEVRAWHPDREPEPWAGGGRVHLLRGATTLPMMTAAGEDGSALLLIGRIDSAPGGGPVVDAAALTGLLDLLGRRGPGLLSSLVGEFALAWYEPRDDCLWLTVDAMGNGDWVYRRAGAGWLVADRPQSLHGAGDHHGLDEVALATHLLTLPGRGTRTVWRECARVAAGSVLGLKPAAVIRHHGALALAPVLGRFRSEADAIAAFRDHFEIAVKDRLRPWPGSAGVMVSGGLDSSAVAVLARRLSDDPSPLPLLAVGFPATAASDESGWRRHLDLPGMVRVELDGGELTPLAALRMAQRELGEPTLLQNLHLWLLVQRAARARGLHMLLDGHDGDTMLYRKRELLQPWWRRLRGWLRRLAAPATTPASSAPERALALLTPEFARRVDARDRVGRWLARQQAAASAGGQTLHHHVLTNGFPQLASRSIVHLGRATGIVATHPCYDLRLLDLCLSLPEALKGRSGLTRFVMREALRDLLPEPIRSRPGKSSLAPQFRAGFLRERAEVEALLTAQREALAACVDLPRVRALLADHWAGRPIPVTQAALWAVVSLAAFLETV